MSEFQKRVIPIDDPRFLRRRALLDALLDRTDYHKAEIHDVSCEAPSFNEFESSRVEYMEDDRVTYLPDDTGGGGPGEVVSEPEASVILPSRSLADVSSEFQDIPTTVDDVRNVPLAEVAYDYTEEIATAAAPKLAATMDTQTGTVQSPDLAAAPPTTISVKPSVIPWVIAGAVLSIFTGK
jgi:hypothetical protein